MLRGPDCGRPPNTFTHPTPYEAQATQTCSFSNVGPRTHLGPSWSTTRFHSHLMLSFLKWLLKVLHWDRKAGRPWRWAALKPLKCLPGGALRVHVNEFQEQGALEPGRDSQRLKPKKTPTKTCFLAVLQCQGFLGPSMGFHTLTSSKPFSQNRSSLFRRFPVRFGLSAAIIGRQVVP